MSMQSMKKLSLFGSLSLSLFLVGCQSVLDAPTQIEQPVVQIPHNDPLWQAHLAQLEKISGYQAKKRKLYLVELGKK